ncbi:MAG: hypothetical protein V4844_15760 [Pseudomonadota bacterium]
MTMPPRRDDRADAPADPERDAWLSAALRHAPDAQAAPPASVSEAILREARAAARASAPAATPAAPAAPRGRWAQAWAWLARPPVAAGFASVMVAALVGLIWWDQPIDPGARPAPTSRDVSSAREAPPSTPTPPATESRNAARSPAPPPRAAPKPAPPTMPAPNEPGAPEAFPSAPPAPAPAPAPTPQADTSAAAHDEAGAPPAVLSRRATGGDAAQEQRAPAAKMAAETAPEPVTRPPAWVALQASFVAEPARWHWQRNGLAQPMTPALQRWLAQFDAATVGRWRRTDQPAPAPAGRVLRLYRDGAPVAVATLRFDAERAWITPETHAAALPAATLDRLLKDLDAATP